MKNMDMICQRLDILDQRLCIMDEKISQILVRGLLVAGLIFQVDQTLVDTRQEPSSPSLTKKKGEPFTFNTDEHEGEVDF